jgi:3-(3-hydroxy-phenyl)propionate hydroxylase
MADRYADTAVTNGYEFTQGSGYQLPEYPFVEPPEIRSGQPGHQSIVIVGGGLAGLTLACALAQLGVPAVLLDEDNTVGVKGASSRGIVYTQKSLEIFQRLGVYERIAAKGVQWSVGRTFAGQDEVYSVDMKKQAGFNPSSQPPFINLQQFYIEGFLVERILALGHVDIRWSNRVTAFSQDDTGATLSITTPAGDYQLTADRVIDASGSHSPFRAWVGASVTATAGDDRWCIADVRFTTPQPAERHTWIEAPFNDNRTVRQHQMADGVWRVDYQLAPDADLATACREDLVRERLNRQFGPDAGIEIVWIGPYAYRSECVDQMRVGRVFFVGDAAKVVVPFGARGGNTGVGDADNLAWKLAAVLRGQAGPALLDSYRTARFLGAPEGAERLFRNAAISLARQHAFARQLVNTGRMAVANTYTRSPVCALGGGQSVQNVSFRWADGSMGTVNDLLLWAQGELLLLVFGDIPPYSRQRLRALAESAPVRVVQVVGDGLPQALEHVVDPPGHLQGACHVFGHAWALVRPDAYVAATGESIDAALVNAVGAALGMTEGAPA